MSQSRPRSSKSLLQQISNYLDSQPISVADMQHQHWKVTIDHPHPSTTRVHLHPESSTHLPICCVPYTEYTPPTGPTLTPEEFRGGLHDERLKARICDIIDHCSPIMVDELAIKLRESVGISRSGRLIKDHCMKLLRALQRSGNCTLKKHNNTYSVWKPEHDPSTWALVRRASTTRQAAHICPHEWVNAALYLLDTAGKHSRLSHSELLANIPPLLGFTHLKAAGQTQLEAALQWGIRQGRITRTVDKHYERPHHSAPTLRPEDLITVLEKFIDHDSLTLREALLLRYCLTGSNHTTSDPQLTALAQILDTSLADGILDSDEAARILQQISTIVGSRKISTFAGETFCVSGTFEHGTKSHVENFIRAHGGSISRDVNPSVTILVHGTTYGDSNPARLRDALRLIENGVPIRIMHEDELYSLYSHK